MDLIKKHNKKYDITLPFNFVKNFTSIEDALESCNPNLAKSIIAYKNMNERRKKELQEIKEILHEEYIKYFS